MLIGRVLGPRYQQLAKNWAPTLFTWGSVAGVGLIWATDWRLFLDYVPYVNGKFKEDK
ncbi:cytochrome b-c1 complex subunit 10 [Pseudophryne corroboree]|uniref:cytochrome b-c1 complex subunit 10 n=1 Tax=Pseudophryne corroboree TaxID=495146 RepID=UPI0030819907